MKKNKIDRQFVARPRGLNRVLQQSGAGLQSLVRFLEEEHMAHSGKKNGRLMATRSQLARWGTHRRDISAAIEEGESLGLITVCRGGRRVASLYGLTYLPTHDGKPPTHQWEKI